MTEDKIGAKLEIVRQNPKERNDSKNLRAWTKRYVNRKIGIEINKIRRDLEIMN